MSGWVMLSEGVTIGDSFATVLCHGFYRDRGKADRAADSLKLETIKQGFKLERDLDGYTRLSNETTDIRIFVKYCPIIE